MGATDRLRDSAYQAIHHGKPQEAEKLFRMAERMDRSANDRGGLAASLNGLAGALRYQERFAESREVLREHLTLARTLGDPQEIAASIGNCAALLREIAVETHDRQLIAEALDLAAEQERIARKHDLLPRLQFALGTQALLHRDLGQLSTARGLFEQQLAVVKKTGHTDEVVRCLANLTTLLVESGDQEAARTRLAEAEELARGPGVDVHVKRGLELLRLMLRRG